VIYQAEDVRRVEHADADAVTDVLATAFLEDPVSTWLFPDRTVRERLHAPFFRVFVDLVLEGGQIYTVGDFAGVTLWLAVDPAQPEEEGDLGPLFAEAVGADNAARFAVLDAIMTKNHPHHEAHAYLPFVAVRPGRQSVGAGTALLRHRFAELDATGQSAYLEASSPRNEALYARLGFEAMSVSLDLPNGPSLQPMWRKPSAG
jgi:ribosomal protein S18 acetylase RimI-like enzyme